MCDMIRPREKKKPNKEKMETESDGFGAEKSSREQAEPSVAAPGPLWVWIEGP